MPIIQIGSSPGQRIEAGNKIIANSKEADVSPVKKRHAAFVEAHQNYCKAETAVQTLTAALQDAEAAAFAADVEQDEAVETLAAKLAGDGFPRANPFKPFKFATPSAVAKMAVEKEVKEVRKLVVAVLKSKRISKETIAAAKDLDAKALVVKGLLDKIPEAQQAQAEAIAARTAAGRPLATAFGRLKRGARAAEDEGAIGLFAALFSTEKKAPAKAKKA